MTRRRWAIAAGAALVAVAVAAVILLVVGGSGDEVEDRAAELVPRDVDGYLHLAPAGSRGGARELATRLPTVRDLALRGLERAGLPPGPEGARILRGEVGLAVRDGEVLWVVEGRDAARVRRALGTASAVPHEGFVLAGPAPLVTAALAANRREGGSLGADDAYRELVGGLPEDSALTAWAPAAALRDWTGELLGVLEDLAGGPRTSALALGAAAGDTTTTVEVRAAPGPAAPGSSAGCRGPRGASPSLLQSAPGDAAAFLELARLDCDLEAALASPGSGLGAALLQVAREARREDVDLAREVLPQLRGQSSFSVTPSREGPVLSMTVSGVRERRALELLGRLQPTLVRLLRPPGLGATPAFEADEVAGTTVLSAELGPGFRLSYAAFDGKLVVSTAPAGIAAAKRGGGLDGEQAFESVLGSRPERLAALLFLDFDELLALGEQVGLAEDPLFQAVRDDLSKVGAMGGVLSREEETATVELKFTTP